MNKKAIIIMGISILGCLYPSYASAQQSNIAKQRIVTDEAISTIEDYESFATIADDEIRYSFEQLFADESAKVYNDLLGIAKGKTLTAKEYSRILTSGINNKKVVIKNIKKSKVWSEDGIWRARFSFDKLLSYIDSCGVYFSSLEFYDKEYHLTATLVFDEKEQKCKIEEITGNIDSSKKLPDSFFAFKSEDKRDNQLSFRNEKLIFNSYGQALLLGSYDKNAFRFSDPDVLLIPSLDECGNVSMNYKERRWRIKPHFDLGLGESLDLVNADNLNSHKTTSTSFGVDFGYAFPSNNALKLGLFTGLGMTQSNIEMFTQFSDYNYSTNADVDGDNYTRHYENFCMSQKVKLSELSIPVYADANVKLHQLVSLYFDLGFRVNIKAGSKVENTEGSAYVYGIYPQYGNLRMDEHWGYNGFGNKTFSQGDLDNTELVGVSGLTLDAFGGLGLRFNIPSTPFSIDLGANYLFGLMDIVKPEGDTRELANNAKHPVVFNTISGQNSVEHVRNLTETFSSVKRKSLRFSMGVIYKF